MRLQVALINIFGSVFVVTRGENVLKMPFFFFVLFFFVLEIEYLLRCYEVESMRIKFFEASSTFLEERGKKKC